MSKHAQGASGPRGDDRVGVIGGERWHQAEPGRGPCDGPLQSEAEGLARGRWANAAAAGNWRLTPRRGGAEPLPRQKAFTLLELLVATALTISIVTIATVALNQMLLMVRRLTALQEMNTAAALLHNRLTRQVSSMHPCTALWLSSDATDRSVELVFMHGREETREFGTGLFITDQTWTRWHWSASTKVLTVAKGRGERRFSVSSTAAMGYWQFAPNTMTGSTLFMLVPQPVRDPGPGGPQGEDLNRNGVFDAGEDLNGNGKFDQMLDANRWHTERALPGGAPLPDDVGDHQDLLDNALPVLPYCTACTIEIVDADGNVHTADGSTTAVWSAPGAYIDGRAQLDAGKQPSLVRLRFTTANPYLLGDDKTTVQATYSFSASTPDDTRY